MFGVMLLGEALAQWCGDAGVWAIAAASGIADVNATTLSLARMGRQGLTIDVAAFGILIAVAVNSAVKIGMVWFIGGKATGVNVMAVLVPAVTAGLIAGSLMVWNN